MFWATFIVLPILSVGLFWFAADRFSQKASESEKISLLTRVTRRILARSSEQYLAARILSPLWRRRLSLFSQTRIISGAWRNGVWRDDCLATLASDGATLGMLGRLLALSIGPTVAEQQLFQKTFGDEFDYNMVLGSPQHPVPISWNKQRSWILWKFEGAQNHLADSGVQLCIVQLPNLKSRLQIAMNGVCNEIHSAAIIDFEKRTWIGYGGIKDEHIKRALKARMPRGNIAIESTHMGQLEHIAEQLAVYVEIPRQPIFVWKPLHIAGIIVFFLAIGSWSVQFLWVAFNHLSVAKKMFVTFLMVVGFPIFGCIPIIIQLLDNEKHRVINAAFLETKNDLRNIDNEFHNYLEHVRKQWLLFATNSDLLRGNFTSLAEQAAKLYKNNLVTSVVVRGIGNNLLMVFPESYKDSEHIKTGNILGQASLQNNVLIKALFSSFSDQYDFQRHLLTSSMDAKPTLLKVGETANLTTNIFNKTINPHHRLINFVLRMALAENNYIQNRFVRNSSIRLLAYNTRTAEYFPKEPRHIGLRGILEALWFKENDPWDYFHIEGKPYYVLGVAGTKLDGCLFVALIPRDIIHQKALILSRTVFWGMGVGGITTLLCTSIILRWLLVPLMKVTIGVQTVLNGQANFRLHPKGDDELARVAKAMNSLLEIEEEIAQADIMQCLFVNTEAYQDQSWYVWCSPVTKEMAHKSFCDIHSLPNSVVVVLGMCQEGNIFASLCLATAKGVLMQELRFGTPLTTITKSLDKILQEIGPFVDGLGLGIFQLFHNSNEARLIMAGIPSAVLISKSSKIITEISCSSPALGTGYSKNITEKTVRFASNQKLLLRSKSFGDKNPTLIVQKMGSG